MRRLSRRRFLGTGGISLGLWARAWAAPSRRKKPVAAIVTAYHENSHADVIVGKILQGYQQDGGPGPDLELVGMYVDQFPPEDMSRQLARQFGFRLAPTVEEALCLGTSRLQVAGVLSIGEHGRYPHDPKTGQVQYPRKRFFDQIVQTFRRRGQAVPVFNDKHLSYNWSSAWAMYRTAQRLGFAFMAGSSLPVAWRVPPWAVPRGTELHRALSLGYGGLESYGFHALEVLQCMVERRGEGESGVKWVQAASPQQLPHSWRWVEELAAQAAKPIDAKLRNEQPHYGPRTRFFLIQYADGLQGAVAMNTGWANEFAFAAQGPKLGTQATWFALQSGKPYLHFAYLVRAIEHMIHTGKAPYPVERTLLTTGVLHAAMRSLAQKGQKILTPELEQVKYPPSDWPFAPGVPPPPRQ